MAIVVQRIIVIGIEIPAAENLKPGSYTTTQLERAVVKLPQLSFTAKLTSG
jgi:hypothetical protein